MLIPRKRLESAQTWGWVPTARDAPKGLPSIAACVVSGQPWLNVLTQDKCARILCEMNVTLSIDEQVVARARKKAKALGKSLNELIRDYLQKLAGGDDPERSIEEFKHLSGRGHSPRGWRFNRDEIHERS